VWGADVPAEEVIPFPDNAVERRFPLSGPELLIGRRSASRGISPEIDITSSPDGPPTDTGVSREHAKLVAGPDGSWSVVDLGTANGTLVNGEEIPPGTPIRLRDGDRVNLGMWTVISINRDAATARGTPSPSGTGRAPGYLRARGQSQRGGEQALLRAAPAH
jgi:pSer/pThr/pTyr-binding forkhead associated (FHA) protein